MFVDERDHLKSLTAKEQCINLYFNQLLIWKEKIIETRKPRKSTHLQPGLD